MRIFSFILFFLASFALFSQGNVHPKVQQEIDALNLWIQQQLSETNNIDQVELKRRNDHIRALQAEMDAAEPVKPEKEGIPEGKPGKIQGFPGSSYKVPAGIRWYVVNIYLKQLESSYRVKASNMILKEFYLPGESLILPAWAAEFSLIDGDETNIFYEVELIEVKEEQ